VRAFTALYDALDATTKTSEKEAALAAYFSSAPARDAAWALHFLTGRRPKRAVTHTQLRQWASEASGVPMWLIDACRDAAGDLSETIALLLPEPAQPSDVALHELVETRLLPLAKLDDDARRELLMRTWRELPTRQVFVFHKLISGSFRVGAARKLVVRALAQVAQIDVAVMDHRLLGAWKPTAEDFARLTRRARSAGDAGSADSELSDPAQPYPFFLASQLDDPPETVLGEPSAWRAEWKWDGIRAQLIRRAGVALVWSRGEEQVGQSFPELEDLARALPEGTVLDGEVLAWDTPRGGSVRDGTPMAFSTLQLRLNRKRVMPTLFPDVPIVFMAYDVLEHQGVDVRARPLDERRDLLERLAATLAAQPLVLSRRVEAATWEELAAERARSRELGVEGLMLKRGSSAYGTGRTRGDWWKWKIEPFVIDAVMTHAQLGSGRRASLFTDYTFGLWDGAELVTVAKAYSGLTNEEIAEVDAFVRRSTVGKHGPVRAVKPELVFEIAFEGVQESTRHRAGLAVRFPRIARWRRDKRATDADTIGALRAIYRSTLRS
jgi:DNA ligase 1